MPSLICSSRYTIDSQILRKAAQDLGWETLRLDGNTIPEWFDPPDDQIAFFYTAPAAFDIARQLGRQLTGCQSDWTCCLPPEFLLRELRQTSLKQALSGGERRFVKHSVSKAFPAQVYDDTSLTEATRALHPDSLVHVGEPVTWTHEFRCFVANQSIQTVNPYVYDGQIVASRDSPAAVPQSELDQVQAFAGRVLTHPGVETPPAFVLDVGLIAGRGWAVVECNECWASGIYDCDPARVLETLLCGSAVIGTLEDRWDFCQQYSRACPVKRG